MQRSGSSLDGPGAIVRHRRGLDCDGSSRDLTNAVGLQSAELEPRVAAAGVACLHRDAFPVAADGRCGGTLVDGGCEVRREAAPSYPESLTCPLRNV